QDFEFHIGGVLEKIDGGVALPIPAGVVGNQADFQAFERRESVAYQNVDAVECFELLWPGASRARSLNTNFIICSGGQRAGDISEVEITDCFGCQRAQPRTQSNDTTIFVGVISIGDEDDEALGERIDPNGSSCPAGVAVGAERKYFSAWTA